MIYNKNIENDLLNIIKINHVINLITGRFCESMRMNNDQYNAVKNVLYDIESDNQDNREYPKGCIPIKIESENLVNKGICGIFGGIFNSVHVVTIDANVTIIDGKFVKGRIPVYVRGLSFTKYDDSDYHFLMELKYDADADGWYVKESKIYHEN